MFAERGLEEANRLMELPDFEQVLKKNGVGTLHAAARKLNESDTDFRQRILDTRKDYLMDYKIYSKKNCTACEQAKALLEAKGIGYEVVDVMTTPTAQALFREKGWRSVPQIMFQGEPIGGFEQLKEKILGTDSTI